MEFQFEIKTNLKTRIIVIKYLINQIDAHQIEDYRQTKGISNTIVQYRKVNHESYQSI